MFEIPMSRGFSGALARIGPAVFHKVGATAGRRARLPGIFSRLGLLERATLTPEGVDFATQRRLVRAMLAQGHRIFTLTYHSPSLAIGHTPYVRNERQLAGFLDSLKRITALFFDELGAEATTPEAVMALAA